MPPNHFVQGIVFDPGDEIDPLRTPLAPEGIVSIAPVINDDGSGSKIQPPGNLHIPNLPLDNEGELGRVNADQFAFKPKLLSPSDSHLTALEQLKENLLIQFP